MSKTLIHIDSLSDRGRGVSHNPKMEVPGALPGEEVLIEKGGRRKGFLKEVLTSSFERVEPRCPHVPLCGGCCIQQMDYCAQLDLKETLIGELFNAHRSVLQPIIGCENPWFYRNKMEFSFSEDRSGVKFLGLFMAGSRGRVANIKSCSLTSKWFAETLSVVRSWWERSGLRAYHHRSDTGHLRTVTLRESKRCDQKMVMLSVSGNPEFALQKEQIKDFVSSLKKEHVSLFLQVHQIAKGRPTQFFEMHLSGPDHITERLTVELDGQVHHLKYKISPTSFFQPNTLQAEKLYGAALEMIPNLKEKRVLDLYCGCMAIGLIASKVAKEVVGIELNPYAVFDAEWNIEANQAKNVKIWKGDVAQILQTKDYTAFDLVIVDPPRSGLGDKAISEILNISPKEILYISCNPKTQAENLSPFLGIGYELVKIQPLDPFPHTMHIENICYLIRKRS